VPIDEQSLTLRPIEARRLWIPGAGTVVTVAAVIKGRALVVMGSFKVLQQFEAIAEWIVDVDVFVTFQRLTAGDFITGVRQSLR